MRIIEGEEVPVINAVSSVIQNLSEYQYLDVAQLIKHILGLVSLSGKVCPKIKKCKLIYLYHPSADEKTGNKHRKEVNLFAKSFSAADAETWFKAMTYKELFSNMEKIPESKVHYEKLRQRYKDGIDCSLWN